MSREKYLLKTYGITEAQYLELLKKQNNSCAVCSKSASSFNRRLAVDHDHVSGEIRGLLCNYCNRRLVGRHRSPELLRRIADYISTGTGLFVPKKKRKKRKKRK
mgnify:CR=1 FL=1